MKSDHEGTSVEMLLRGFHLPTMAALYVLSTQGAFEGKYPERMRRVRAIIDVDGVEREMEFLTNNMDWSPRSVADLCRARWAIEVFFKQIKQTLKLADFLGHSAIAVRWQFWSVLLCYLVLRFQAWVSGWAGSLTRIFTLIRSALWQRLDLAELLKICGTAGGSFRAPATPESSYFPAFRC